RLVGNDAPEVVSCVLLGPEGQCGRDWSIPDLVRRGRVVDDRDCDHSRNRWVQCSDELSRPRYRCVDDADTPSASPFGTYYSKSRSDVWARIDLNLTYPGSPSEPLLSPLDGIGDFGQRRGLQFTAETT